MVREYKQETDFEVLAKMLEAEDVPRDKQLHDICETYVLDDNGTTKGFFTIKYEWDYPSLQHFYVAPHYRDGRAGREMVKAFIRIIKAAGFTAFITHAPKPKLANKKAIEYMFHVKPYAEKDNKDWYFVPVARR